MFKRLRGVLLGVIFAWQLGNSISYPVYHSLAGGTDLALALASLLSQSLSQEREEGKERIQCLADGLFPSSASLFTDGSRGL